jgi:hypothetical protein
MPTFAELGIPFPLVDAVIDGLADGHEQELADGGEAPVRGAVGDDVPGGGEGDAEHVAELRGCGGVEIDLAVALDRDLLATMRHVDRLAICEVRTQLHAREVRRGQDTAHRLDRGLGRASRAPACRRQESGRRRARTPGWWP